MARSALSQPALDALRILAFCPEVPTDAFAQFVNSGHPVSTYQLLGRLRGQGLATSKKVVLGPLLGSRNCSLWSVTPRGRTAVLAERLTSADLNGRDTAHERTGNSVMLERVASYRALAGLLAGTAASGQPVRLVSCTSPWRRSFHRLDAVRSSHVRLAFGATLEFPSGSSPRHCPVLLITDIGTMPVFRYLHALRRLAQFRAVEPNWAPLLFVVTFDPAGTGARLKAWRSLVARAARYGPIDAQFTTWDDLAKAAPFVRMPRPRNRKGTMVAGSTSHEFGSLSDNQSDQILALVGRHPFLMVSQLAGLLSTSNKRITLVERGLLERGWLRLVDPEEFPRHAITLNPHALAALGFAELTMAGARELARRFLLPVPVASGLLGLICNSQTHAGKRRRLLRHLAHTVGCNEVFVAFATAARAVRARGGDDALEEWRSAAACERHSCRPDGYGRFRRGGASYGFFVEYDRGTERSREYAAKLNAYYKFRDSGAAAHEYVGFPTLLIVSTSKAAEERFAHEAYLAWLRRGGDPWQVLLTTTPRIVGDAEGILGPIWRRPDPSQSAQRAVRTYWPPVGSARGLLTISRSHEPAVSFRRDAPVCIGESWRGRSSTEPSGRHNAPRP